MDDAHRLAERVASLVDATAVVELARALVRLDSVAAPGRPHEAAAASLVLERLRSSGLFEAHSWEVAPLRPNVVADWRGRGGPGRLLAFEGHTDVVTEGDRAAWSRDPFGAELDGGRLWGRGSADMKGGLAAAIVAAETVARHAPDLPGGLRLLVPCDEEGMMSGIRSVIAEGWADGLAGAIVCEPEENELCLWQRGGIRVAARFHGKQAHGAMPYAGVNPLPWAARFVLGVRELERELQAEVGEHEVLGRPTLTPTVLAAGSLEQLNVMPGEALVALDVRTVPGVDHVDLHGRLRALVARLERDEPGFRATLETLDDRPWTATDPASTVVRALEAAHPFSLGRAPRYGGVPGTTDGTFLHAAGVPIVTIGPGDRLIPHQVDEFVPVDDLVASARLYAAAAVLFLTGAA